MDIRFILGNATRIWSHSNAVSTLTSILVTPTFAEMLYTTAALPPLQLTQMPEICMLPYNRYVPTPSAPL